LLANTSMPLKFWDEAFLTATYLINILPSKVTGYNAPVELLLHEEPDYGSLRIFGCACWLNLRPYNTRKLLFGLFSVFFWGIALFIKDSSASNHHMVESIFPVMSSLTKRCFLLVRCIQMPGLAYGKKFSSATTSFKLWGCTT
jgi:hypothetical protein